MPFWLPIMLVYWMSNWPSAAVENMNLHFLADIEVVVLVCQKVTGYRVFGRIFKSLYSFLFA